jgi:hypothetical protein
VGVALLDLDDSYSPPPWGTPTSTASIDLPEIATAP